MTPGMRVRLVAPSACLTLRSDLGTIVGPAEWGYLLVRLDAPAIYHDGYGGEEDLQEIREAEDNLVVVP